MYTFPLFLIIINFFLFSYQKPQKFSSINSTNKKHKISCSIDKVKPRTIIINLTENEEQNTLKQRQLQTRDEYETIRIYLSTVKMKTYIDGLRREEKELTEKIYEYLDNVVSYVQKLIKVKPLVSNIKVSYQQQVYFEVSYGKNYDETLENPGVAYDLVIFPLIESKDFSSEMLMRDASSSNRVIAALISIPAQSLINTEIKNKQYFIETQLLHEFTHILGFYKDSFQYFPGGLGGTVKKVRKRGVERNYIITKTVVNKAIQYFGCNNVIGIELEDQEQDQISSHWDARILLGEYMNQKQYSPEVVMSDFTLALLEDSGWYKVNYYTGGLMRFGKKKDCKFFDEDCCNALGITQFKNEFFDYPDDESKPSCSSGRLSRTYNQKQQYGEFSNTVYARFDQFGGKVENADYCFVFHNNEIDENGYDYYVGSCNRGNGKYGSQITYNNYGAIKNEDLFDLAEQYTSNSFCILSEAFPVSSINKNKYQGVVHPMCYEMFCSNRLTVKISNQYIVCPRQGGKVKVDGNLQGYIYCPDYNLICTGSVICNDIFDCIEKGSTSKVPNYDYTVDSSTSSQKISEIKNSQIVVGYEVDDTGKCPINCSQCRENKKCLICRSGYNLIGEKENDDKPIICDNQIDVSKGYYKKDGIYYACLEFCVQCNNGDICLKCDNIHKLDSDGKCIDKVPNCAEYDISGTDYKCKKCKTEYAFIKEDREACYLIDKERYYTEDGGISYYPCDTKIKNCDKCREKNSCIQCKDKYYFLEKDRTVCYNNLDLYKYYTEDGGISYYLCENAIKNCDRCYSSDFCYLCQSTYYLKFNDNNNCYLESELKQDKTYYRFNGTHYKKCSDTMPNCNFCSSGSECDRCMPNYYFINNNREACINIVDIDIEEYYQYDEYNYHACSWLISHCRKCDGHQCNFCQDDYTLVNDDYTKCHSKENLKKGYYQNEKGNMYYPCINNCDKCVNGYECIECSPNYYLLGDETSCGSCMIAELIVKDEVTMENMDKFKQTYINNYKNNLDVAAIYSNPSLNYTLSIFRTWQCTEVLIAEKYYKLDISELLEKLKKKFNKPGRTFLFSFLNYNYRSYFEVYDLDSNKKINIEVECPECVRVKYEITNNYSSGINHILGIQLSKVVYKYNINVLNSSDEYFHDSCKKLELESIDVPLEQRRSILYLGKNMKKVACLDDDCTINSLIYDKLVGICSCKLNFDYSLLTNNNPPLEYNSYDYEIDNIFTPVSGINPLPVFTCSKETFDSKNIATNASLYIGCIVIIFQLSSFIYLILSYCLKNRTVKEIASPPPKDYLTINKKTIFTDDTEKATQAKDKDFYDISFDSADSEKKAQDKDEGDEEELDNYISGNIIKKSHSSVEEDLSESENKSDVFNKGRYKFQFEKDFKPDENENIHKLTTENLRNSRDEQSDHSTLNIDIPEEEVKTIKNKIELDYIILSEAIKRDNRTLWELYFHILPLKQPIWDMLSHIKALEINKSFVPLSMKIIRFFFMLSLNMFMNSLFLTQNYFEKKFIYFNEKYNLQYNEEIEGISSAERFGYALKNTAAYYVSNFIICLIIQFIINYYLFNLREKIWDIIKENNEDNVKELKLMYSFMKKKKRFYIIIASINFVFIIFFFFYIINFSEVFRGGIIDYIGATFMTWLLLQIIPFITSLISALFRYYGLKKENNRLYKLNQVYLY